MKHLIIITIIALFVSCDEFQASSQYEQDRHYAETRRHNVESTESGWPYTIDECQHGRIQSYRMMSGYYIDKNGTSWRLLEYDVYDWQLIKYNKPIKDHGAPFWIFRCEDCGAYYKIYSGDNNGHLWWLNPTRYE